MTPTQEEQKAGIIGRFRDHNIRDKWQDCEIGDVVPEASLPSKPGSNFKRIGFTMTSLAGGAFETNYYWERIR